MTTSKSGFSRRAFVGISLASLGSIRSVRPQVEAPRRIGDARARIVVKPALRTQTDLIEEKEHCSVDRAILDAIGRGLGQQVRIDRNAEEFAIFTVTEARDAEPASPVRMGRTARVRLDAPADFSAVITSRVTHPTFNDAEAQAAGEFVERLDETGDRAWLAILAPHGGGIEPHSDQQAERLAASFKAKGVAAWRCKGWHPKGTGAAFERWHITSTETSEASFPLLKKLAQRKFDHAVSFHGMSNDGLLIGGGGPMELKRALQAELNRALAGSGHEVKIASGKSLGGSSPRNIVNRYCKGTGIQIEQSPRARKDHWQAIADAVARFYETV